MTENQPAPSEKSQAEGDREVVDEAIDDQESAGMPSSATVEQEIADSD